MVYSIAWFYSLQGSTYHIPVSLYLLDNHPYGGPYCYVSPTANMRIRSSNSVDDRGRIYLPYLTEWRYPSSDTLGLLQVMVITFQEKCPVFSVSGTASGGGATGSSGGSGGAAHHPAPYPTAAGGAGAGGGGYHMPTPNAGFQPPPYPTAGNLPPYPTSATHPNPHQPQQSHSTIGMPQPSVNVSPYGSRGSLNKLGGGGASAGGGGGGGYYPAGGGTGTIQSSHIHASLLSAVEDKIRQKLTDKIGRQ